jgi:predicted transcriptional regulator
MKLKEIQSILDAEVIWGNETQLEIDIDYAGASDLMSDVLSFSEPGLLFLTGLANAQSVRTANIIEAKAIIYVRGKKPDTEGLELAMEKGIPILSTRCMMYEACGLLRKHGLPGITEFQEKKGR